MSNPPLTLAEIGHIERAARPPDDRSLESVMIPWPQLQRLIEMARFAHALRKATGITDILPSPGGDSARG
jgi:hypothetical protein